MEFYETLDKQERAELVKAVKRLNERMRELERQGLTGTKSYQRLSSWVANTPNAIDKTGHLRAVQTYKLTSSQVRRLNKLANDTYTSARGEISRAKGFLTKRGETPTREEIKQQANDYGEVESYIRENLSKIYDLSAVTDQPLTRTEKDDFIAIMKNEKLSMDERKQKFNNWLDQVSR